MSNPTFESCENSTHKYEKTPPQVLLPVSKLPTGERAGGIKEEKLNHQPEKDDKICDVDGISSVQIKMENKEATPGNNIMMHRKRQKHHRLPFSSRETLKIYTCEDCPAVFSRVTQLKYHARVHLSNDRENLECEGCHIVFSSQNKLLKHKQRKHFQNLTCGECNSRFSQTSSFRLHMRLHSGERPYCCNECDATFVQSSHLNIHKRTHTGEKPYQCDVCKQTFKQISHLRTHERIHTQTKPFSCEYCGNAFIQKSSLNRHMRIHTGERPYECSICHATFCVKNNLNRHMAIHNGSQPFDCELCGAAFGQSVDLKRHKISHTGVKPFRCEECQATFSRNNNLKWHKFTHTGETPFKCDQCNCRFMKPRDLKKHKMNHGPPKLHTCPVCQQEFPQSTSLKKHMMLIHTMEKPFSCNECSATFVAKTALKKHMQKHSGPQLYKCNDCDAEFKELKSLKKHSLQNHNKKRDQVDQCKFSNTPENEIQANPAVDLQQNSLPDSSGVLPSQFMTYQLQLQDPSLHSTLQCSLYNPQDSQQPALTYATSTVGGLPSLQPIVQTSVPTLMISAGPGQPVRAAAARPANNCQNHYAHVITMTSNNQLQSWCFCEVPTIPQATCPPPSAAFHSEVSSVEPDINASQAAANTVNRQPPENHQQEELIEKLNEAGNNHESLPSNGISQIDESHQPLFLRPFHSTQTVVDGKATSSSQLQFHLYTDGGQVPHAQPVWINQS